MNEEQKQALMKLMDEYLSTLDYDDTMLGKDKLIVRSVFDEFKDWLANHEQ